MQNLRYSIVREDGDLVDIMKGTITFSLKASPQVCHKNLGALQETYALSVPELDLVSEATEITGEKIHQCSSGTIGIGDAVGEAAIVLLQEAFD
jgi:hypothetical protein